MKMVNFLETIKLFNKKFENIEYHNLRLNKTIKDNYNIKSNINLLDYISPIDDDGLYRCRVIYNTKIEQIEYIKQQQRVFKKFKITNDDGIEYKYKYINRENINKLFAQKGDADDIIIVKDGLLTDTSICNIAIFTDKWYTPAKPLLYGTTRARLIDNSYIYEKNITIEDLKNSKKFAIMNALIDFYEISNFEIIF